MKLVFPLALCLVPALYVVCLGPIIVRIMRTLCDATQVRPSGGQTVDSITITLLVVFAVLVVAVHDAASEPSAQPGLTLGRSSVRAPTMTRWPRAGAACSSAAR